MTCRGGETLRRCLALFMKHRGIRPDAPVLFCCVPGMGDNVAVQVRYELGSRNH